MTSYTSGIDLGGTNLRIAAYTRGFGLLETNQLSTGLHDARGVVISDICQGIRSLRDRYSVGRSLAGVAIGSPGPIELPDGRLRGLPNFPE